MKKNVFLKIASVALVLCLASTCAIGTTFAKYTTADSASDTARVAKWGITVSTSGTLFGKNYAANSALTDQDSIVAATSQSVSSSDMANIVAPGTKNTTGFQVKLSGTPEVQYNVTAATTGTIEDIFLAAGTYGVMVEVTGLNAASDVSALYTTDGTTYTQATGVWDSAKTYYALHDTVTLADAYYPITWTVSNTGSAPAVSTTKNLTDVAAAIVAGLNNDAVDGNANENSAATYTLTWEWAFHVDAATDAKDTILGNLMAADTTNKVVKKDGANYTSALTDGTDYNLEIAFGLNVTVDQLN